VPATLAILRPLNCLFIGLCVLGGLWRHSGAVPPLPLAAAVLSAMLIGGAGYVINDFFDLPIDRVNRPNRPLPAGRIQPNTARRYAFLLFTLGILISVLTLKPFAILTAVVNSLLLYEYARSWKARFLIGNLAVAALAFTPFLYGGIAVDNARSGAVLGLFAMLLTMIRELVKDVEDVDGDRGAGARTLAIVAGRLAALGLAGFFLAGYAALIVTGVWIELPRRAVCLLSGLTTAPILAGLIFAVRGSKRYLGRFSAFIKLDMLLALAIVVLLG
jgi:geranylgeranylglycerol-phosphate geranylgeranyltransferase